MCLSKTNDNTKNWNQLKKASKDIRVYKVLREDNKSPYERFQWEKGMCHYEDTPLHIMRYSNSVGIVRGLYAFTERKFAFKEKTTWLPTTKIVVMYIPKGANYMIGDDGQVVSDQITWY